MNTECSFPGPTKDVDGIIEVSPRAEYDHRIREALNRISSMRAGSCPTRYAFLGTRKTVPETRAFELSRESVVN